MSLPIVYKSPENPNVIAAKKKLWEELQRLAERRRRDAERPVPNRICYANTAFKDWKPGDKVPPCHKCGGLLHPNENHKCDGFQPKFVEHTPERKERWEAKREEIRESRRQLKAVTCSVCGEILECPEDAEWHWEQHEGKPEREHHAIDGEPDGDLDGYEDEPEEDYCEGDDDGYDCD